VDGVETGDVSNQETRPLSGEKTDQIVPATEVIPAIKPASYETEEMPRTVITAQTDDRATEVIEAIGATPATQALGKQPEAAQTEERATEVIEAIGAMPVTQTPKKQPEAAQAEERATEVIEAISATPATQKPKKQAKTAKEKKPAVKQPVAQPVAQSGGQSGGRKKLALAAGLGVVAVVAATFFIVNSRRPPESQAETQPANNTEASTPAQTVATQPLQQPSQQAIEQLSQPSGAVANNQAQSQTRPQPSPSISELKSAAIHNDAAASKPQPQVAAKPTSTVPQEKQVAGGTISAQQILDQAKTYLNAGRYQETVQECERLKKLDPGNKDIYYLMGSAYSKLNQLEQAIEAYRQCTSGVYANVSQNAVKNLQKKLGKVSAK
jgi:tetratricopeptide (TPR) repeat protein